MGYFFDGNSSWDVHLLNLKEPKLEFRFQQGVRHVNQVSVVNTNYLMNIY